MLLTTVTLYGQLINLEPMTIAHAAELSEAASESRSTYQYTHVPNGISDAELYIASALSDYAQGTALPFVVRHLETNRIVGATRFLDLSVFSWPPPWPPGASSGPTPTNEVFPTVAEIGSTWYAASVQRTGVNTECKLLMLAYAFETWQTVRVTLKTDARNDRSRAAIARLGAQYEGIRRAHVPATDGSIRDTAYYSILAAEWPLIQQQLKQKLMSYT